MFHKILVPLDGSPLAEEALTTAMAVAKANQAEVLLLRSIQPVYTMMPVVAGEYEWIWPEYAREDSRREIRDYLNGVKARFECVECPFQIIALEGDPASDIVDTAEEEQVDLIVMSTHGQTGVRRAVFGSVTERVLHSVACPVLVTRSEEPIRRILITLDGSDLAERAVEPALEVARAFDASIILLRINEILPVNPLQAASTGWDWEVTEPKQRLMGELRQAAEGYLREIVLRHHLSPAEVQTIVLDGSPVDRIQEFARLYGIDLIAMSTHGRTGLRRWLYGSVTVKVMRASECSMLIIRPPEEELNA
jgi:nucleotide-binding universal stress UspA family protein